MSDQDHGNGADELGAKEGASCPHCGCQHRGENSVPACEEHKQSLKRQAEDNKLVGIKGWLAVPVYGWIGAVFFQLFKGIYDTAGTDPYEIAWAILLLPLISGVAILAGLHHRWFKWAWIGMFGAFACLELATMADPEISLTPYQVGQGTGYVLTVVFWSIYLLVSKRAKETFTRSGPALRVLAAAVAISVFGFLIWGYNSEEPWEITLDDGRTVFVGADAEERLRSGERVKVGKGVYLEMEGDEILYYDHEKTTEEPWESDPILHDDDEKTAEELLDGLTNEQLEELQKMLEGSEEEKPAAE